MNQNFKNSYCLLQLGHATKILSVFVFMLDNCTYVCALCILGFGIVFSPVSS